MFIRKGKRAQSTAEYAILIGVVVAAILAMQAFVRRSIMGKVKEAAKFTASDIIATDSDTAGWFAGFSGNLAGSEDLGKLSTGSRTQQDSEETEVMEVGGQVTRGGTLTVNVTSNEIIYGQ